MTYNFRLRFYDKNGMIIIISMPAIIQVVRTMPAIRIGISINSRLVNRGEVSLCGTIFRGLRHF